MLSVNNLFLQLSLLPATETQHPFRRHSYVFFFVVMDFNQLPLTLNVKSATFSHGVLVARYKYMFEKHSPTLSAHKINHFGTSNHKLQCKLRVFKGVNFITS